MSRQYKSKLKQYRSKSGRTEERRRVLFWNNLFIGRVLWLSSAVFYRLL